MVGEVSRFSNKGAPDSVREVGVAAVQDCGEQVVQQRHEIFRYLVLGQWRGVLLRGDRHATDLPACRPGDLADRLPQGQEARTRNLVELTRVPVLRQRGNRDVRDVSSANPIVRDARNGTGAPSCLALQLIYSGNEHRQNTHLARRTAPGRFGRARRYHLALGRPRDLQTNDGCGLSP